MDLGIIMSSDLQVLKQFRKVVSTANLVLDKIYSIFTCRSSDVLLPLFKVWLDLIWSIAYRLGGRIKEKGPTMIRKM